MTTRLGVRMVIGRGPTAVLLSLLLAACGSGGGDDASFHTLTAAEIVGTYDLTTTFEAEPPTTVVGVGVLALGDDLRLDLTSPAATLHGTLGDGGTLALAGHTTDSDFLRPVTARGKIEARDGVYRVMAALDGDVPYPVTIVMTRPIGADLRSSAGRYHLAFAASPIAGAGASSVDFAVPIDAGGSASVGDALEVDVGGRPLATLAFGSLHVAPSGRFHFESTYAPVSGSCDQFGATRCLLQLEGSLPLGDEDTATGRYTLFSAIHSPTAGGEVAIGHSEPE